jgi:S-adenosylmethionine:tRNA ribosyltransferase-isomerase
MKDTNNIFERVAGISISDYSYDLPDERIAKYPLDERDQSKLLVWNNGKINDSQFFNLVEFLTPKSLLIFNNTRVIRARLLFQKETGAKIEIFCLDPFEPADYQIAFQTTQSCVWHCMVGNQKKWKGEKLRKIIRINDCNVELCAEQISDENKSLTRFTWDHPEFEFAKMIEYAGILPIPPYLNRETEESDLERYQTVYSKIKGSVAAPTAGLHFTERVFADLKTKGHQLAELTLHVGAGTFQPVKSKTISGHEMHAEHIYVNRDFLKKLIQNQGKKIAVGTTSVRTLESLFWLGLRISKNPQTSPHDLFVSQWEPYLDEPVNFSTTEALQNLVDWLDRNKTDHLAASTQIIIVPGYTFRIVDGLITNFHQPQSTLLLLISAYLGDEWKNIYDHALQNGYRFLSYGDSNLYLK